MKYDYEKREMTTCEVARLLQVSERQTEALFADRRIPARQLRSGAWLTDARVVQRYIATAQRGRGRTLSTPTAWGLLWELSGRRPSWLGASTLSRVRQQIASSSPEEIVRATSGRTRARYFLDPIGADRKASWSGLIRTGRPAARHLGIRSFNYACGYVRDGTTEDYATRHAFWEDYDGWHVLFDNTLPVTHNRAVMPDAVIAVDLAVTGGAPERQRAMEGIAHLQGVWAEARR